MDDFCEEGAEGEGPDGGGGGEALAEDVGELGAAEGGGDCTE